jgi:hypothetical protein
VIRPSTAWLEIYLSTEGKSKSVLRSLRFRLKGLRRLKTKHLRDRDVNLNDVELQLERFFVCATLIEYRTGGLGGVPRVVPNTKVRARLGYVEWESTHSSRKF